MKKIILLDALGNGSKLRGHKHLLRDWTGGSIPGFLCCPPLELMYAAAYLREQGFAAEIIEASVRHLRHKDVVKILEQKKPDFVLIPSTYLSLDDDKLLSAMIRKKLPQSKVIFSGSLVTHDPQLVLDGAADFVVLGELESGLLNILNGQLQNNVAYRDEQGKLITCPRELIDISSVPIPARDMISNRLYRFAVFNRANPVTSMSISRGCVHSKCSFCHCNIFSLGQLRFRLLKDILEEIGQIVNKYGIKEIFFRDQAFTADRDLVVRICDHMIDNKLDLFWRATTRVDCVDPELLQKMKQAGCYQISFGLETNSQHALDLNTKGIKVAQAYSAVKWAKAAGLEVLGLFIFGLPGETRQTMDNILPYAFDLGVDYAIFNSIYLGPGIPVYEDYKQGKIDLFAHGLLKRYVRNAYLKFYFRPAYILKQFRKIRKISEIKFALKAFFGELISHF